MDTIAKRPSDWGFYLSSILISISLMGMPLWIPLIPLWAGDDFKVNELPIGEKMAAVQNNSLLPVVNAQYSPQVVEAVPMVITAYSSSPWETDDDPFITASGTYVRQGVVANNLLPLGTKIRLPDLYGDRVFVVEDRMNSKKGYYQLDIWFPSHWEAKSFGAKRTKVEILGS